MYLQQIPTDRENLDDLPILSATFEDENEGEALTTGLMIDNQLELRVGGAFHSVSATSSEAPPLEAWGEGGGEALWARLMKMDHAKGCLYELKLSGHRMGFPDFARADPACTQQTENFCKM